MGNTDLSNEEMQRYIEEQKKKIEEALARMTPEKRAQAEKNYAALKEADDAAMRKTLDDARAVRVTEVI
jgi:membrane protein involved in colicin uptake